MKERTVKKQTFAGMTAAAALAGTALVMAQPGAQPGQPGRDPSRPSQVNRPMQPGNPGMPGMRQDSQQTFQFAQEMASKTQEWKQKCEQTTRELEQSLQRAQSAQGDEKVEALVQIIEKLVNERKASIDGMVEHQAMLIRHELKSANVPQEQVRQLEQQYAFLNEGQNRQIRGIDEPDLDVDKPSKPGGMDDPLGPR